MNKTPLTSPHISKSVFFRAYQDTRCIAYSATQPETNIKVTLHKFEDGFQRIVVTNEFGRCVFRGEIE